MAYEDPYFAADPVLDTDVLPPEAEPSAGIAPSVAIAAGVLLVTGLVLGLIIGRSGRDNSRD